MKVRALTLTALLSCLLQGCYSYGISRSHTYIHLPEYGYLPKKDTFVYVDFVAYDFSEDGLARDSLGVTKTPRKSLPQTLDEAKSVVSRNIEILEPLNQRRRSETAQSVPAAVVMAPAAMLYWAPVIGGVIQATSAATSESATFAQPSSAAAKPPARQASGEAQTSRGAHPVTASELSGNNVAIRVSAADGRALSDAAVLLLRSPSEFTAYADQRGRRTYPGHGSYTFHLSEQLALALAEYLGAEGAPGALMTDGSGEARIPLSAFGVPDMGQDSTVLVLVKKGGYRASVSQIPLPRILAEKTLRVVVGRRDTSTGDGGLNPWLVARLLQQQTQYYEMKYYNGLRPLKPESLSRFPSIPFEEFEKLVLEASRGALDHPIVQSARFYYEIEKGRPEAAKAFHRFIEDKIYLGNVYKLIWLNGIPLN
jgi:hypothetical protein